MALFVKLWTDILADPKLMRAARKGAKQLALLPWMLVFAKQADDEGRLTVNGEPAEAEDVAAAIPGITAKQVAECWVSLESMGVLVREDDALAFANWHERSGKPSDGPEAINERVKRHRARKRGVTPDHSSGETPCNALHDEKCNATEIELEKEKELEQEKEQEMQQQQPRAREALGVGGEALADSRNELVRLLGGETVAGATTDDFLAAAPDSTRYAWARGLIAMLVPLGAKHVAPDVLLIAMQDFLVSDREKWPFAGRVFRAFVDDVNRPRPTRSYTPAAVPDTADALARWAEETDARETSTEKSHA